MKKLILTIVILIGFTLIITCSKGDLPSVPSETIIEVESCVKINAHSFNDPVTYTLEEYLMNNHFVPSEVTEIEIDSCGVMYKGKIAVLEFERIN